MIIKADAVTAATAAALATNCGNTICPNRGKPIVNQVAPLRLLSSSNKSVVSHVGGLTSTAQYDHQEAKSRDRCRRRRRLLCHHRGRAAIHSQTSLLSIGFMEYEQQTSSIDSMTTTPTQLAKSESTAPNALGLQQPNGGDNSQTIADNNNNKQEEKEAKKQELDHQVQERDSPAKGDDEPSVMKKIALDSLLVLIKAMMSFYDLVSQPIFYWGHQVYKRQHENDQTIHSEQFDRNDPLSAWHLVDVDELHQQLVAKVDSAYCTYDDLMRDAIIKFGSRKCYGYRRVLDEQWIKKPELSGKLQRQMKLSDYHWISYDQFERQIEYAKRGLLLEGVKAGHKVMLYSDTRPEWQIVSHALIRMGAIVVTMYSTLGIDGILHSVNETEVSLVVAQKDKVERLLSLKSKLATLKRVIYLDGSLGEEADKAAGVIYNTNCNQIDNFQHTEVECSSFGQLLARGRSANQREIAKLEGQNKISCASRTRDSLAIIMYTSGSTGIPKGVLISHGNILATIKAFSQVAKDFVYESERHIYGAYLPLAHIFEFGFESLMLFHGVPYGFATPHTLTDKSPGLAPGQRGDLSLLKPTVLIVVPLILDRIVQAIKQGVREQSYFKRKLLTHLISYKKHWQRRHYDTPLVDKIVCSKLALALGGRAKFVISGSAPLASDTQTFARAALNLKLPQGYGTTETCAATCCQLFDDHSTTNVGLPVAGASIKLEAWEEGNYRPSDKPNPRGEIVVGGEMIARGYFNLVEQTAEAFYVDNNGVRWYRTGDIGEFLPSGQLRIIDRKKDLVKLQNGEYISLGKVESTLKSNPYTENFCAYASSAHNFVVVLGPANELGLRTLASQIIEESSTKSNGGGNQALLKGHNQDDGRRLEELADIMADYEKRSTNTTTEFHSDPNWPNKHQESTQQEQAPNPSVLLERLCANQLIQERALASITELAYQRNLAGPEVPRKLLLLTEEWTEDKNLVTAAMKIRRNYIFQRYKRQLEQLYGN